LFSAVVGRLQTIQSIKLLTRKKITPTVYRLPTIGYCFLIAGAEGMITGYTRCTGPVTMTPILE